METKNNHKGKLIVIEGCDGAGKATQSKLLVERLQKDNQPVEAIDFPRYYNNFFGKMVGECITQKYGDFTNLDPHIASVMYACDRWESKKEINAWLDEGKMVVADRYASANQLHQAGKVKDETERKEFLGWLDQMEHGVFQIPRPDLVLYLDLSVAASQKLLKEKALQDSKEYKEGREDQTETDLNYAENARQSGLKLVAEMNNFYLIDCNDGEDGILSREEIHEKVYEQVLKIING